MKIFVSHSSKDKEYGEALVQFMLDIGVSPNNIIFTSKPGYGIPKGENIFQWLKSRLQEKPFVIYLLSDNYYLSIPCLNEMGAAWIIENNHISLFTPRFKPSNSKFSEGAIDPRELGIFINNKEDMIAFAELIIDKKDLDTSHILLSQAISKFTKAIVSTGPGPGLELVDSNSKENASVEGNLSVGDNANTKITNLVENVESAQIIDTTFMEDILKGKLSEEELLLIKCLSDTGEVTLGDRWMAEGSKANIKRWQDINNLNNKLFKYYDEVLGKFKIRKYVIVKSETSHGNPREYILIEEISKHILNLPEEILKVLDEALKSNIIYTEYTEDLPF